MPSPVTKCSCGSTNILWRIVTTPTQKVLVIWCRNCDVPKSK